MKGIDYFNITALSFIPAIVIEVYLQVSIGWSDIRYVFENLWKIELLELIRNILALIAFVILLVTSRLRLKYLKKSPKKIIILFIPFINILFFLYLSFSKDKITSQ